jgi:hypothetical protein
MSPLYHVASIYSYLTPMVVGVVMLVLVRVGRGSEAGGVDDTRNPSNTSCDCTPLATPAIV